MKITKKQYKAIKRKIDIEEGVEPFKTKIHKSKKIYTRREKHKNK